MRVSNYVRPMAGTVDNVIKVSGNITKEDIPFVKQQIVDAYRKAPSLRSACRSVNCPPSTAYLWKNSDEEFAEALLEAREEYRDYLRDMAQRRAEGVEKVVIYKGEVMYRRNPLDGMLVLDENFEPIVLTEIVHSDRILETLMTGNLPEHKKSGGVGLSIGGGDGKVPTKIEVHFQEPPDWDNVEWDEDTGRPIIDVTPIKEPEDAKSEEDD